jgi:hypothetical protein
MIPYANDDDQLNFIDSWLPSSYDGPAETGFPGMPLAEWSG